MAHTFDEQLYRLLDIVESIELEPFTANVYPVYAERNTNVRVSRRESLEGVRALVDARLETLQRIATKIDFLERDLHYRRACLVNAHAPVEVLPPEVLGEIFATAVAASPPLQARRLAVTISHVSSFWRAVAIRQPMMWRRVVLCDNNRSWHPRWSLPGLAEEWIRRASNSPLDVLVEQQFFQTLRRLEIPNWKIRSLSLVDVNIESDQAFSAPSDWNYIRDLSLPSLETLCITTSPLAEPMVTFTTNTNSFPSLRNLIITGNWRRLLWDLVPVYGMQLRGLFLKGGCVGVGTYRTISQFCPSLEVLCLDDNVADFSAADMDEGEIWEFKTITDLEARNFSPELSNMLARHACFPNLRSFVFTTMDTGVERDPVAHQNVLRGMVRTVQIPFAGKYLFNYRSHRFKSASFLKISSYADLRKELACSLRDSWRQRCRSSSTISIPPLCRILDVLYLPHYTPSAYPGHSTLSLCS